MFGSTNTGMTGIQFQNTSVKFSLQSTPDFADYPYRGQFANSGITAQAYAEVVYSGTQASSGNYAPFCQTYDGGVYLYAKTNVGTQVIPTIAVGTASFSLTIDNNVTQNSQNPVSSGGVWNVTATSELTVTYNTSARASSMKGWYRIAPNGWLEVWIKVFKPASASYGQCTISWNKVQFNDTSYCGMMGFNYDSGTTSKGGISMASGQTSPLSGNSIYVYCGDAVNRTYYLAGFGTVL